MIEEKRILEAQAVINELRQQERFGDVLRIVGASTLQQLNIEVARARLYPLTITHDYVFLLNGKRIELFPVHKALYILFLKHPEGIEFKYLSDHVDELLEIYQSINKRELTASARETIERLVDPLNNSINEKCARIKAAFAEHVDQYQLQYYCISSHTIRHIEGSSKLWFERKKTITLPRDLVVMPY